MTAILVLICLIIWLTAGEKAGLITSSLATSGFILVVPYVYVP